MKTILLSIFLSLFVFAQIPEVSETTMFGKDFWLTIPPPYLINGDGNGTQLYIFSEEDATVLIETAGKSDQIEVEAGEITLNELSVADAQVYNYQIGKKTNPAQIYDNRAVNVTSDKHIKVTMIAIYTATSDGTTIITTTALGTEYVCASYDPRAYSPEALPNWYAIVATTNNTNVKIKVNGNNTLNVEVLGQDDVFPGDSIEILMNEGDVYLMGTNGPEANNTLAGTYVTADKPIATFSANYCADIPSDNRWCDFIVSQDIPIKDWGQHFMIPYVENKVYPAIMRIFASEEGTSFYRDGIKIAEIGEENVAGGRKNYGWIEDRIWPRNQGNAGKIALISGDKPISVAFYNPSTQEDGNAGGYVLADPFMTHIPPIDNMVDELTINIPGVMESRSFQKVWINLVY